MRIDLSLTLADDGRTFLAETTDATATLDAAAVLALMPDELKAVLARSLRQELEESRVLADQAESDRRAALERKRELDGKVAGLEAVAEGLPAPPEQTAAEDTPAPADTPQTAR